MTSFWIRISLHDQGLMEELPNLPHLKGLHQCQDLPHLILELDGDDALIDRTLRLLEGLGEGLEIVEAGIGPWRDESLSKRFSLRLRIRAPGFKDKDAILIRTGSSFGTGLHPTTEMCLQLLEELMEDYVLKDVFDLGTGSGILALCATRLGAQRVLASDILMDACKEASLNVQLNGYKDKILVVQDSHEIARPGGFDLVLANLLEATLKRIIPEIPTLLRPEGFCILSGLTIGQMKDLLLGINVFQTLKTLETSGWAAALLKKKF